MEQENRPKIGLAFSGGGYRAAAFHIGTLRKLKELNILDKVYVISTISGGSIAGAFYLLNKGDFQTFEKNFIAALKTSVIKKILFSPRLLFTLLIIFSVIGGSSWALWFLKLNWLILPFILLSLIIIVLFQFIFFKLTAMKISAYEKIFFHNKTLNDLPDTPKIAINATNLETGTLWTYSKEKVSDSSYEFPKDGGGSIKFVAKSFPIATAVASSTSVPAPFNPVQIDKKYFATATDYDRVHPSLVDGGLYDNQGIHKITQYNSSYACDVIICSDGSQPFKYKFNGLNSVAVLYRATDVMMRKIKNLQFIRDVYDPKREIAYYSLDWQYDLCVKYFISEAIQNKVSSSILAFHNLDLDLYKNGNSFDFLKMSEYLKNRIGFTTIVQKGLSKEQILKISLIGTNLTALTGEQICLLSGHAEVLTELQIKLYCPSLHSK